MALDFYSTLDRLYNPTNEMNGGNDAQAYAQLILGGGQASLQDPTTGAMVPILNGKGSDSAAAENVSPSFAKVLRDAEAIAAGARGDMLGRSNVGLVKDPTGPGMYDPTNPAAVAAARQNAQAIDVPYTDPASRAARGQPVGADPTSEAFYSTSKLASTPSASTQSRAQLVANPYGPGSYDPNDPEQVAQVRAAGQRASKADEARQLIRQIVGEKPVTDPSVIAQELLGMSQSAAQTEQIMKNLPQTAMAVAQQREQAYTQRQQAANPVVKQILDSLGVNKTDDPFAKAFAQSRGKELGKASVAGGKTKAEIPEAVMRSIGTEKYAEEIGKWEGKNALTPSERMRLEGMHQGEMERTMVKDPDRRVITSVRTATDALGKVMKSYEKTPAFKTGKMSDTFRTALALSTAGAAFEQMAPFMQKLSPEEQQYVADANVFSLNLRNVSQDSRFSNFDSQKVLQAVGNPIVGKDLYMTQIKTAVGELQNRHDNVLDDLKTQGRRVEGFKRFKTPAAKSGASGWTVTVEK